MERLTRLDSALIDSFAESPGRQATDPSARSLRSPIGRVPALWILFALSMLATPAGAQGWAYSYGSAGTESAKAVQPRAGGGYVVAAEIGLVGAGGSDFWLLELDAAGEVVSQRAYGGLASDEVAWVHQTSDGGYVMAGSTTSFGAGGTDAWVIKVDASGVIDWQKRYGGVASDSAAFVESLGAGYVVGGATSSFGAGESDLWLLVLDADGEVVWQKAYGGPSAEFFGSLQPTADGGFILGGSSLSFVNRNSDAWVVKLDSAGAIEWQHLFGHDVTGNESSEWPARVQPIEPPTGGVTGYTVAVTSAPWPAGNEDIWVLELDSMGQVVWQTLYETVADYDVHSLQPVSGGYLIAGSLGGATTGDGWLMKIDDLGGVLWQKTYGGENLSDRDSFAFAMENPAGGLVAVGESDYFGVADDDAWVLELDADGGLVDCLSIQDWSGGSATTAEVPIVTSATVTDTSVAAVTTSAVVAEASYSREQGCHVAGLDQVTLPQSGQSASYAAGDDGDILPGAAWPVPRFTDHGDGTVTDRLTGLMWLKDGNCAGTLGLGSSGAMNWTTGMGFVAGINDGTHDISACASYTANHRDWRAPNINEMASLRHAGVADSAVWLNGQGFANAQSDVYYSSTAVLWNAALPQYNKWAVRLDGVYQPIDTFHHAGARYMWPVRGGQRHYSDATFPANVWKTGQTQSYLSGDDGSLQRGVSWPEVRFTDHGDGTVTDELTGLVWLKDSRCFGEMTWQFALDAVADLNADPAGHACVDYSATHPDWRLPSWRELFSLFDRSVWNTNVLPPGHPFVDVTSAWRHWTSTTDPANASLAFRLHMGGFGGVEKASKTVNPAEVWPVRGGPVPEPGGVAPWLAAILTLVALRRRSVARP